MPSVKAIAQLDLNLLKVLEALYQQQNMTRAAEHLNITPSAVSHAMKRLRDVLDDPLFVRQGANMAPTAVCRRLMPDLMASLGQLRQTLQTFGEFDPASVNQTIRFAIHDAIEPLFFTELFSTFQSQAPGLTLHSVKLQREQLELLLETGEVDFAIDVARALSHPVQHAEIASSSFCVLAGRQQGFNEPLSVEGYGNAHHVTVSNRPTGKVLEDLSFAQLGFNRNVLVRCQNYQSALSIVQRQPLLLTLPQSMADYMMHDGLVQWPLPFDVPEVKTHLYWHEHSQTDGLLNWVRETIFEIF